MRPKCWLFLMLMIAMLTGCAKAQGDIEKTPKPEIEKPTQEESTAAHYYDTVEESLSAINNFQRTQQVRALAMAVGKTASMATVPVAAPPGFVFPKTEMEFKPEDSSGIKKKAAPPAENDPQPSEKAEAEPVQAANPDKKDTDNRADDKPGSEQAAGESSSDPPDNKSDNAPVTD